jgi:hypothetical protein
MRLLCDFEGELALLSSNGCYQSVAMRAYCDLPWEKRKDKLWPTRGGTYTSSMKRRSRQTQGSHSTDSEGSIH